MPTITDKTKCIFFHTPMRPVHNFISYLSQFICFSWCVFQFYQPIQTILTMFFLRPLSVHGWTSSYLLDLTTIGRGVPLRGDWAIFCHDGLGRVGRARSAKENPLKCFAMAGNWTRAMERTDIDTQFILPLSYYDWFMHGSIPYFSILLS